MAANPQVIVLSESVSGTNVTYSILFWIPITANPVPQTAGSIWTASGASAGASSAQNTAIQAGSIREEAESFEFPVGTPVSAIEAILQQAWTNRNGQINGQGANQYYGSFWNGTAWGAQ